MWISHAIHFGKQFTEKLNGLLIALLICNFQNSHFNGLQLILFYFFKSSKCEIELIKNLAIPTSYIANGNATFLLFLLCFWNWFCLKVYLFFSHIQAKTGIKNFSLCFLMKDILFQNATIILNVKKKISPKPAGNSHIPIFQH